MQADVLEFMKVRELAILATIDLQGGKSAEAIERFAKGSSGNVSPTEDRGTERTGLIHFHYTVGRNAKRVQMFHGAGRKVHRHVSKTSVKWKLLPADLVDKLCFDFLLGASSSL